MTKTLHLLLKNGWLSLLAEPPIEPPNGTVYRVTGCPDDVDAQAVLARFFGYWLDAAPREIEYATLLSRVVPVWLRRAA